MCKRKGQLQLGSISAALSSLVFFVVLRVRGGARVPFPEQRLVIDPNFSVDFEQSVPFGEHRRASQVLHRQKMICARRAELWEGGTQIVWKLTVISTCSAGNIRGKHQRKDIVHCENSENVPYLGKFHTQAFSLSSSRAESLERVSNSTYTHRWRLGKPTAHRAQCSSALRKPRKPCD